MPTKSVLRDINDIIYPVTTVDSVYNIDTGDRLDSIISKKQEKCVSKIITISPSEWIDNLYTLKLKDIKKESTIFWEVLKDDNYKNTKVCKISCDDIQDQNGQIVFSCYRVPKNIVQIKIAIF